MSNQKIHKMVGIAILMAIVVVLQLLGQFIKFGPVSISLVLLPIVVGAALYGPAAGAILGATFGVVVLLQPDTSFFYGINTFGTVLIVMLKGALSGWLAGLSYRLLSRKSPILAAAVSAVVCPVVNTAIFFVGCMTFFRDGLVGMAGENVALFVITAFIGVNFLAELAINVLCCPVIVRLMDILRKNKT